MIVIPKGITLDNLFFVCKRHLSCTVLGKNLDTLRSVHRACADYIVWLDEDGFIDFRRGVRYMPLTFEERLILELKHYGEEGNFYDRKYTNLCLGSRFPDGDLPSVFVDNTRGELCVGMPVPL